MVPKERKDYVKGLYGKSPAPMSEEIKKKIIGDEPVFTGRPADLLKPEYAEIAKEIGDLAKCPEDVLMYAMFPQIAKPYLENRNKPKVEKEYRNINIIF